MELENKQQKILLELISSKDKTFDSESLRTVAELCYPTGNVKCLVKKINIPEIFGDAVSRSSAPGKLGRRKYLYTFKATTEELVDRVNKFYSGGKRRVTAAVGLGIAEKSVIELVYTYITELPTTNTEFKKKFGVNPPSEDLVKTLLEKFCNIKGEFTITKVGTSKVKDFEASDDTEISQINLLKQYYRNTYKEDLVPYKSTASVSKNDRNSDDKKPNSYFIPNKRYENVYSGLKLAIGDELDIKISTLLLNKMIEINKDTIYYDSCFAAFKEAGLELPKGFNLDQWAKKSNLFKASYSKLYLDPKYKNLIKGDEKRAEEDKKEEKTEEQPQTSNELTIHVISQDRLRSLKYTSIKLVEELKDSDYGLYRITVDFNKAKSILDTFGILSSLERSNGVIVEKDLAEKVKNFVMDSLEAKLQEK